MSYIEHAKREFLRAGYKPIEECEEDPDKWSQKCVLDLLEVFSGQGHSGYSAPFVIDTFKKLANFEPLAPIMCTDDEWNDVSHYSNEVETHFQNIICSSVFKDGKNGEPYYIDAIIWVDEKNDSFTSSNVLNSKNEKFSSHQTIKLPFIPKKFYIDIVERNDGYYIKDESQLKDVWEFYEKPDTKTYIRLKKLKQIKNK